jgi:vacuolar-type H+-ATPase subunit I/STV1
MMTQRFFLNGALLTTVLLVCAPHAPAQGFDYVTEEEEDVIRDAQGVDMRVPLMLKLLDNRIVALGLRQRTAKEREQTKKDLANYESERKAAAKVPDAELRAKPLNPDVYLREYSRSELLRGYMQVIDETMDYIEDSHDRKLDVRDHVEDLEKFLSEQLPRLKTLEPKTPAEASAIKSALAHSERALQDCRDALQTLRKTLKSDR